MKTKYKLLALVPLIALVGCKRYQHKNVITGIGTIHENKVVFLEDVQSGKESIYKFTNKRELDYFDYLKIDDTVTIEFDPLIGIEHYYQTCTMLDQGDIRFRPNTDTINARRQREILNQAKSEMQPIVR